jgi:hypothetical protein
MARDHTTRGGLVMAFTSDFGSTHPESFWCASENHQLYDESKISLIYRGWANVAAYNEGYPPIPGAERRYQIDGAAFDAVIMLPTTHPTGTPLSLEMLERMNEYVIAMKDVPVEGGDPVSFFEEAVPAT